MIDLESNLHDFNAGVLVVDLDGSLVETDLLHESFWSALTLSLAVLLRSLASLFKGRSFLKHYLSTVSDIDAATLPYNEEVITYISAHRAKGGRLILATGSSQLLADRVADHLGFFDEVHGSSKQVNLVGANKARFLVGRFGHNSFSYIGDSRVDLPVWEVSSSIITVKASQSLRKSTELMGKPVQHLDALPSTVLPYFRILRSHQWLKNLLIFLPMLAAHDFELETFFLSSAAFVAFSFMASSAYVFNDLLDLKPDRAHPIKKLRPFASGDLAVSHGAGLAFSLVFLGLSISTLLNLTFMITLICYFCITATYSLVIKRIVVLDICVLSFLYTLRIVAGSAATGLDLSIWLLAFALFFFLSLAAVKRQAELVDIKKRNTFVAEGRGYDIHDLPIISMFAVSAGYISVLIMCLYINSPEVQLLYDFPDVLWGICCVLAYWITRMVFIANRGLMHYDPIVFSARDRVSYVCLMLIIGCGVAGANI